MESIQLAQMLADLSDLTAAVSRLSISWFRGLSRTRDSTNVQSQPEYGPSLTAYTVTAGITGRQRSRQRQQSTHRNVGACRLEQAIRTAAS
jgi:hypothetical protein